MARKTTVLRCLDEKEFKSSYSKRPIRQDIWSVNRSFPLNKLPLLVTPTCVLPYATAWWGRGLCMLSRDFWKKDIFLQPSSSLLWWTRFKGIKLGEPPSLALMMVILMNATEGRSSAFDRVSRFCGGRLDRPAKKRGRCFDTNRGASRICIKEYALINNL